jgi:uroporphyrinogen decarboxylase
MNPRERIILALSCKPTDVVPFDLGGTKATTLNARAYENLKAYLGVTSYTELGHYRGKMVRLVEEVSQFFDSDVRYVHIPNPSPLPEAATRPVQVDEWGTEWTQGATGLYYITHSPLQDADSLDDLRRYNWPDPATLLPVEELAQAARKLRRETDCATCLNLPVACVHKTQHLRGFENWLIDSAANVSFFEALMGYVTDIYVAMVEPLLLAMGDSVDLILICDDIGIQSGPLISPAAYRKLVKPHHARIFDAVHANSPAKILYHSCGSVYWALGDLIDIGIDGLNPVQVSAAEMDPVRLKREFGDKVCFWGAVDTQSVLPNGNPPEVREEVRRRIDELATGGGYVCAPCHNIQAEVPPENILAMAEAAHVYGGRSDGHQFRQLLEQHRRIEA